MTHRTSPRSTSCSSTRKPSCSRSEMTLPTPGAPPAPAVRAPGATCLLAIAVGVALAALVLGVARRRADRPFLVVVVAAIARRDLRAVDGAGRRASTLPALPVMVGGDALCPPRAYGSGSDGARGGSGLLSAARRARLAPLRTAPTAIVRDVSAGLRPVLPAALAGFAVAHGRLSRTVPSASSPSSSSCRQRHRRLRPRCPVRQAPDGPADLARRSPGRASPARSSCCCVPGPWRCSVAARGGVVAGLLARAALVVVHGDVGDLCESMVKRDLGVKDMGTCCPATVG